jgi:twitching motility protein PilT
MNAPLSTEAKPEQDNSFIELDTFLKMAVAQGASDIHLRVGTPPTLRKDGQMLMTKLPPLTEDSIKAFARGILPPHVAALLGKQLDFDFSFQMGTIARFRVNLFHEMNMLGMVLRVIPLHIPTLESLDMPSSLKKFSTMHKGLVLVTGPTGSGKSTTLAALLNLINQTQCRHVVTLEDPVEYYFQDEKSIVTQRQIGVDTDSFPHGIKYALRQDPDVMLVGEMRDRETIMAAIQAAETGHLVFSTLHTSDTVQTIHRIINAFEPHEREPIRLQLAGVLQGAVSQRLLPRLEGKGRIAIAEVLFVTPTVRDYIFKNETDEIYHLLNNGTYEGMISLNNALYRAFQNQQISSDAAMMASENPVELQQMFRGAFHGTSH